MKNEKSLIGKCQIINVGDGLAKYAQRNSKKELKEFYISQKRYALEIVEKNIKFSRREKKDLSCNLHNTNIYLGEY